ncbi:hypothetical protein OROGR_028437 [Orobanche gracilis]
MGASESSFANSQNPEDGITTVSEHTQGIDPILQRLRSLQITMPTLTSAPEESTLTDILVPKSASSSTSGTVNYNVLLELFSIYHNWQEEEAQKMIRRQGGLQSHLDRYCYFDARDRKTKWCDEIENKIEVADALAVKLLQRFNYSVSAIKTTSDRLSEVHDFQVELGELKGRLTEVISNCDALCKRIGSEGPESLQSSVRPLAAASITD